MRKINIIKESKDFERIIKNNRYYKTESYIAYLEKPTNEIFHFGLSVSKKVGNAVTRNKIKRQLKYIIDKKTYQNGFNCIIIVRKAILEKTFNEMETELINMISKFSIIKGEKDEKQN